MRRQRAVQALLVFRSQGEQPLYGSLIMNLFGEATASGHLNKQIGPLTADLIRQFHQKGV
jgi:hypothetical protein